MMPLDAEIACKDRLDLVDAAMARPGSPAAHELRNRLCSTCQSAGFCLMSGIERSEHGIWGGTSPQERTAKLGARQPSLCTNLTGVSRGIPTGRSAG